MLPQPPPKKQQNLSSLTHAATESVRPVRPRSPSLSCLSPDQPSRHVSSKCSDDGREQEAQLPLSPASLGIPHHQTDHNRQTSNDEAIAVKWDDDEEDTAEGSEESKSSTNDEDQNLIDEEEQVQRIIEAKLKTVSPFRRKCYLFFVCIDTPAARLFVTLSLCCTLLTLVIDCLSSYARYQIAYLTPSDSPWKPVEIFIVVIFIIDFVGRFYGSCDRWKFWKNVINITDFVTIWPFFFELALGEHDVGFLSVLGILKAVRVVQVIRLARFSVGLQIAMRAVYRSLEAFLILITYALFAIFIFASAMYFAERGTLDTTKQQWIRFNGEVSPFQNIPDGFYWAVTTLSTTGYGDITPITTIGKILSGVAMFTGVTLLALPVSIIGSNFMSEWLDYQRSLLQRRVRLQQQANDTDTGNGAGNKHTNGTKQSKAQQIHQLQSRCDALLQIVGEVQDRLADVNNLFFSKSLINLLTYMTQINPPRYYLRYKAIQRRHWATLERVQLLERECEKWKHIAKSFSARSSYEASVKRTGHQDVSNLSPGIGTGAHSNASTTFGSLPLVRYLSRSIHSPMIESSTSPQSQNMRGQTNTNSSGEFSPTSSNNQLFKQKTDKSPRRLSLSLDQNVNTSLEQLVLSRSLTERRSYTSPKPFNFLHSLSSRFNSDIFSSSSSSTGTNNRHQGMKSFRRRKQQRPAKSTISGPITGSILPAYNRIPTAGQDNNNENINDIDDTKQHKYDDPDEETNLAEQAQEDLSPSYFSSNKDSTD